MIYSATNRPRAKAPHRRGISMVETIMALFTLMMATMTAASVQLSTSMTMKRSQNIEVATAAAREQLESIRRSGFSAIPAIPTGANSSTSTFTPSATSLPSVTGTATYTQVDASLAPSLLSTGRRKVSVNVTWAGSGSNRGTVTLTTLMSN